MKPKKIFDKDFGLDNPNKYLEIPLTTNRNVLNFYLIEDDIEITNKMMSIQRKDNEIELYRVVVSNSFRRTMEENGKLKIEDKEKRIKIIDIEDNNDYKVV